MGKRIPSFLLLAIAALVGCGERQMPSTLIVHCHDGVYDFIDHQDRVLHTSADVDDYKLTIQDPKIQELVVGNRVVIRFEGVRDGNGLSMPASTTPAMAELAGTGVLRFDFDYTND